ncbi:putative polyketide biosynthesis zinc-dependent hydrolase PksB [Anatilimnocola aggregata]|uniref:Putative polyketide biosynthesis zinc-dependent hydrolase PksB n=1 Tax=Anatilimnocola aggregata TaxID=2528021 RepID=A0A517YEC6_9BACT|nr:MBL fold metallo-hydrolase [Anatilimnocola aggregata]QDU28532.1 putative polyketide biosynthesis zinc-dependent hydrolase PksB [Anatilimnocola aggregata]
MQLKQYYLGCLSHASYLITDEKTHTAVVVDPQRDVEQYIADAAVVCCEVKYVFLTHFHADFLAGHIELRDKCGANIYLGQRAEPEFAATKVKDGDRIEFGDVRLEILETPGHTPEGISILVYDLAKNKEKPYAVLTGDTLFIGDVGRPDLLASIGVTADELSDMLYDSLTNKLVKLPDETLVYPAHGAGSMCGKNLSKDTVSTIGQQKKFNYALQPMSRAEFKKIVTEEQPEAPSYFVHDAILNRKERPNLDETLSESLNALSLEETLRLKNQGAQLLDVREAIDFEGAHLAGSINVGIQGKYATWCGTVLNHDHPIVVVTEVGKESEAVMRLGRIGYDNVAGYLRDGMDALRHRPDLVAKIDRITAVALSEQLASNAAPTVVDVRSEKEWAAGHIAGSVNIPLNHLNDRAGEIEKGRPVVVHCEGGYRSAIAASVLANAGRPDVLDMVGGFKAWAASKLPVQVETTVGTGA